MKEYQIEVFQWDHGFSYGGDFDSRDDEIVAQKEKIMTWVNIKMKEGWDLYSQKFVRSARSLSGSVTITMIRDVKLRNLE